MISIISKVIEYGLFDKKYQLMNVPTVTSEIVKCTDIKVTIYIANHNSKTISTGFDNTTVVCFPDLRDRISAGFAYLGAKMKNGHRAIDNYIGQQDVIIIDIDDGCSILQARSIFAKFAHSVITTKSHLMEGKGERFRVFLPVKTRLPDDNDRRLIVLKKLFLMLGLVPDKATKDSSRFFYASLSNSIQYLNDGILFDWKLLIDVDTINFNGVQAPNAIKTGNESNKNKNVSKGVYKWDEIEEIWKNEYGEVIEREVMDSVDASLKGAMVILDEEFHSGNHSNCLFKVSVMLKKEDGLEDDRIVDFLMNENKVRGGSKASKALHNIKSGLK